MDWSEAERLFRQRLSNSKIRVARGFELNFDDPRTEQERTIKALIDQHRELVASEYAKEIFEQRTRLALAQRKIRQCESEQRLPPRRHWRTCASH